MARVLVAVGMVLLLLAGSVTDRLRPAKSGASTTRWCWSPPPRPCSSRSISLSGLPGLENLPLVTAAQYSRIVEPADAGRATLVRLEVLVPRRLDGGTFATRVTASTGAHATGDHPGHRRPGRSGEPMPLKFKLGVP